MKIDKQESKEELVRQAINDNTKYPSQINTSVGSVKTGKMGHINPAGSYVTGKYITSDNVFSNHAY